VCSRGGVTQTRRRRGTVASEGQPRRWLVVPGEFGRKAHPQLRKAQDVHDQVELIAARAQHEVVRAVRDLMANRGVPSLDDLAERTGMSAAQLGRLFRGETTMTLLHLALLQRHLGPDDRLLVKAQSGKPTDPPRAG